MVAMTKAYAFDLFAPIMFSMWKTLLDSGHSVHRPTSFVFNNEGIYVYYYVQGLG